jgi:excisionase family DNA binding protein
MRHEASAGLQADLKLLAAKLENATLGSQLAERGVADATAIYERILAGLATQHLPFPAPPAPEQPSADRAFYRIRETAKKTGLSERTIARKIDSGELESVKRGKSRLVRAESLDRFIAGK